MLESWEIRWFGEGAIPVALQQWSEELNFVMQPVRSDLYLVHNGGKYLGIKWREGNIQIKELIKKEGQFENYQKWSFALSEEDINNRLNKYERWQSVTKKREMAKWMVKSNQFIRIDIEEEVENGCEVELSALLINHHLWWTVAYEATGGKEILEKTLDKYNPPVPKNAMEMGYAEWIALQKAEKKK